jgi:DNA-binding transcriptional regulator YhcF (GntR family)
VAGRTSPAEFRLDPASGVPTCLQLVHRVEHALRLGYLEPGDQLPKVPDVVASLAINPNTVLEASRDLQTKGLAAGRPGQGSFVPATLSHRAAGRPVLVLAVDRSRLAARVVGAAHRRNRRAGSAAGRRTAAG